METTDDHSLEPDVKLDGIKTVQEYTGFGRTQIWKFTKTDPTFPKPVHIGRRTLFVRSEIQTWIRQQIAARDERMAS